MVNILILSRVRSNVICSVSYLFIYLFIMLLLLLTLFLLILSSPLYIYHHHHRYHHHDHHQFKNSSVKTLRDPVSFIMMIMVRTHLYAYPTALGILHRIITCIIKIMGYMWRYITQKRHTRKYKCVRTHTHTHTHIVKGARGGGGGGYMT